MKQSRNSFKLCLLYFTAILAAFAATSLLENLPLSSASTSPATSSTAPKKRSFFGRSSSKKENSDEETIRDKGDSEAPRKRGIFGRSSSKNESSDEETIEDKDDSETPKKRAFFGRSSSKNERSGEAIMEDKGDSETVEETGEKQKSSWQFFYRKNEESATEIEDDEKEIDEEEVEERQDPETEHGGANVEDAENEISEKHDDKDGAAANINKSSLSSDDKDDTGAEDDENLDDEDENSEENVESGKAESEDLMEQHFKLLQQSQQRYRSPGAIIYRSSLSPYGNAVQQQQQQQQQQSGMSSQGQAMAAAAVINLLSLASRLFFLKWIINKLAFESESKSPIQHFMWECLNDKYIKDDEIWKRVLSRVPHSMGVSQRKWDRTVKAMRPERKSRFSLKGRKKKKRGPKIQQLSPIHDGNVNEESTESKLEIPPNTSKTVVVMDFSTMNVPEPHFLRFADVVTFLVSSNNPKKQLFGKKPEIILMLQSPGGEVTSFAFAAAQVARLRDAGWNVTVCVDRIAASGGYMIASQATQILASPFAMVGSVGVITESLNFYEILKKHGIQSLVLKAGDSKNPITQFGKVTDENIKTTQEDLDETHQSFIELCRSRRPTLDPAVCNGRILSGNMALESGMIDRILTSDEYILEKISEGDLVMKLHLVSGNNERHMIANALQILPHLTSRFKRFVFAGGDNSLVGKLNSVMDGNFASKLIQILGLTSMIRGAITRNSNYGNNHNNYSSM